MVIKISEILARFITRHPWWFVTLAIVISAVSIPGITRLETETGFSALVSPQAEISIDNARYEEQFGGEPFTILLTGSPRNILSTSNVALMADLEQHLAADQRYRYITSPLTMLEIATGTSYHENPQIIEQAAFDQQGILNPLIQGLFPDDGHALIQVTPAGNLTDREALEAAQNIEAFLQEHPFDSVSADINSDAGLIDAITTSIGKNIAILLGLALAVMIIVLLLFFRIHWRLLSIGMVGIAALWTFGLMGYLSVPMSMATMAVLPILLGLGIDFSIQFQNRYQEEITRCSSVSEAIITSIARMFPVVGIALLGTIAGFVTLFTSRVPMIKDFGLMLSTGIFFSYLLGLFLLHSVIYIADRHTPISKLEQKSRQASGQIERILTGLAKTAIKHTAWVAVIAVIFAIAGGLVDSRLPVNTDYEELMPQDEAALADLRNLREITGSGGQLRFLVEAERVDNPAVLEWMLSWSNRALEQHSEIISVNSPAILVSQATGGIIPPWEQVDALLGATPELLRSSVIADNRDMASVDFIISYISLEEVHDLIKALKETAMPLPGVSVSSVGTMALGAETIDAVIGSRMLMNLLCFAAVFVIILLSNRRLVSTALIVFPVVAVIAWSSLDMFLIGVPLNPLTSILGVLIIGIGTEFMVMINGRYQEEKNYGAMPQEAMITAVTKTGRAIMATSLTTLGGFGVLLASNFVMIRDFGIVTVLGVLLCLVIALAVMPGLIVWYDKIRDRHLKKRA